MSILQWNLCGYRSKYPELIKLIEETSPVCLALQETMLGNRTQPPPTGYSLVRDADPDTTPGHGLAILIKRDYPFTTVNLNTDLQAIAIQIQLDKLITICNIYISPTAIIDTLLLDSLIEQLREPYLLLGDFNAKHELWGERNADARGRSIADWVIDNNISMLNDGSPTHYHIQNNSLHAVDLSLCSPRVLPTLHWGVMGDLYGSDHFPLKIETETEPPLRQRRYNMSRAEWRKYRECAYGTSSETEFSLQERYSSLMQHVKEAADRYIPKTNPYVKRPVP